MMKGDLFPSRGLFNMGYDFFFTVLKQIVNVYFHLEGAQSFEIYFENPKSEKKEPGE